MVNITESQFKSLKNKEEEIEWKELLVKAQEDCKPEESFKSQEDKDNYFYFISKEMLEKLDVERDISINFNLARIPRTYSCYAIWMGNDEGVGFGGYRTLTNDLKTYSIIMTKEELRSNFN